MIVRDRLELIGETIFRMHEANYADSDSESRATWTVPADMGALFQAYRDVCINLLRGVGLTTVQAGTVCEHLFYDEAFNGTQVGVVLVQNYNFQWAPVDGCEDCEIWHTVCPECLAYGESTTLVCCA